MWWGYAMKLTFVLSLVAFLAVPPVTASSPSLGLVIRAVALYFAKLGVLLLVLALWETVRSKMRLRAILPQLILAIGVLLFTLASLILTSIQSGG
jgi:formate hydrogenlyase subunit 4